LRTSQYLDVKGWGILEKVVDGHGLVCRLSIYHSARLGRRRARRSEGDAEMMGAGTRAWP